MSSISESHPSSDSFVDEIRREFSAFRIVAKDTSRLSRVIDLALRILTLGGQRRYMTHYHTVLGATLYVPARWESMSDLERVILLRHERVHLRQRRRYGFLGMAFLYLIPIFPLGLAYGRARLEWEAYEETLRATAEHYGMGAVLNPAFRAEIVSRFTGPDYGWMWPFPGTVNHWYDRTLSALSREREAAGPPTPGKSPLQGGQTGTDLQ